MGKQPTVRFLLPELRIHRSVPPTDSRCNGTCIIKPCAERQRRSCHRGERMDHRMVPRVPEERLERAETVRAASEDGTGGPLTKVIEYDVPPTHPGRGNARGARGGL